MTVRTVSRFSMSILIAAILSILLSPYSIGAEEQPKPVEFKPTVGGYIEGWYRGDDSNLSNQTTAAKKVDNEFRVRRVRLDVKGMASDEIGYKVTAALDGPSPASGAHTVKLWDGYITYKANPLALITFGQFAYPFTLDGPLGTPDSLFVLKPESINAIASTLGTKGGSFRDIGVMASGGYKETLGLKYAIAFINGAGINTGDNNSDKDIVGRVSISPISGLTLGASYYTGKGQDETNQTLEVKESASGVDVEYLLKDMGLSIRGEYVKAKWENWNVATGAAALGMAQEPKGYYLQAAYKLPPLPNLEVMARYEDYEKDSNTVDSHLKTTTLGAAYWLKDKTRITASYLLRDADVSSIVTAQETDASGVDAGVSRIGNLFVVQMVVAF